MEQIEIVSILITGLILAYFIFKTFADFIDLIRGGQKKPNKFDDRNITFQNGSIGLEKKQYPYMYENDDFRYKIEPKKTKDKAKKINKGETND